MKFFIHLMVFIIISIISFSGFTTPPFSNAVLSENMLYISGQIASMHPGKPPLIPGDIKTQTKKTMENIGTVLKEYNLTYNHLIKCTVMMADMREWDEMNEVYATYFDNYFPARSAFGTTGLALGAKLEIECIAQMNS
jgi:2-iminobutanoate/2-iminopropanoate deaminase